MDLAYWGFSRWPFLRHEIRSGVDVGAAYLEAQSRLIFLADEYRRCGLLTGVAGIGKTRLFRQMMRYVQRRGNACFHVDMSGISADELVWQVADRLLTNCQGVTAAPQCWQLVQQSLAGMSLTKRSVVALFEHLDQADRNCLVAIRRLMNLADSQGTKLTVLLASRTPGVVAEIWDEMELLVHLEPWTSSETNEFIEKSLNQCGSTADMFTAEALATIHEVAQGVPGEVIRICDLVLLAAMGEGLRRIDGAVVTDAAVELVPSRPLEFSPSRR